MRRSLVLLAAFSAGDAVRRRPVLRTMRLPTILLSAALLGCTAGVTTPHSTTPGGSNPPNGPRGPYGEVYGTQVSVDSGAIGDSVVVTLTIANPTSATMRLVYGAPFTFARFMQNDTTFTTVSPQLVPDTVVLGPNADTTLAPIMVYLTTQPLHPTPTGEVIGIPAGTYNLAACAFVPQGSNFVPDCGPTVQFTVTP